MSEHLPDEAREWMCHLRIWATYTSYTLYIYIYILCKCVCIYIYIYIVTAIGHCRIIMQGSKNYYEDRKWGRRLVGLRALATVKKQPRRSKGLDPDKEKTCHWSRQGGRFTAKKKRNPKSQFRASPRKRKVAFSHGPVKREILVTEWPNRSRRLCWVRNWGST